MTDITSVSAWGKILNGMKENGQTRNAVDFSRGKQERRQSKVRWDLVNNVRVFGRKS